MSTDSVTLEEEDLIVLDLDRNLATRKKLLGD